MKTSKQIKRVVSGVLAIAVIAISSFSVSAAKFSDTENHWAEKVIDKWSEKGVIRGYDGKFSPDLPIIRGDFAVIISRVISGADESDLENVFSDLNTDTYYSNAVLLLNKKGIMLGSDGMVRPNDNITREEAFVMLSRAYDIEGISDKINFEDENEVSDWAYAVISSMCKNGTIKGSSDNKIHPKDSVTRAEVVQLLENINKLSISDMSEIDKNIIEVGEIIW